MISTTSLIFAAVAVAIVWWLSRQPSAASISLPPLSPLPGAALPPLPGPAPAGGFHYPIIPWLIVAVLLWMNLQATPEPKPDGPSPAPVLDLDLRGVWHGETAAEDAAITETILSDLAWFIEDDARLAEPRLKSGQQLAELRMRARQGATHGVSLAERQPRAIDAIAAYLDREIGDKGGPLTPEDRAKWIRAFRAVSAAAGASLGR
jgi:hypothetical protein